MTFLGINLITVVQTVGLLGVCAIIFAETGLFIGFFFPGDSLLFVAGVLASQGYFSLPILLIGLFVAGVLGNLVGYWFGHWMGERLFQKEDSLLFRRSHLHRAHAFYEKYGGKTIVMARFVPIVRTFAPIVAGAAKMHYPTFFFFNVVGALLWTVGLTWLAYYLGTKIENLDHYLLPIILIIIFLSILPGIVEYWRHKRALRKALLEP